MFRYSVESKALRKESQKTQSDSLNPCIPDYIHLGIIVEQAEKGG